MYFFLLLARKIWLPFPANLSIQFFIIFFSQRLYCGSKWRWPGPFIQSGFFSVERWEKHSLPTTNNFQDTLSCTLQMLAGSHLIIVMIEPIVINRKQNINKMTKERRTSSALNTHEILFISSGIFYFYSNLKEERKKDFQQRIMFSFYVSFDLRTSFHSTHHPFFHFGFCYCLVEWLLMIFSPISQWTSSERDTNDLWFGYHAVHDL